jgi:hypothetical protein
MQWLMALLFLFNGADDKFVDGRRGLKLNRSKVFKWHVSKTDEIFVVGSFAAVQPITNMCINFRGHLEDVPHKRHLM